MHSIKADINPTIYDALRKICLEKKISMNKAIENALEFWIRKKEKDAFFKVKPVKFKKNIKAEDIDKILYGE